ncbi:MAG: polysaccharide biosynthesis protein, partial [Candidatus Portnoybacteria bacterium]
MSKLDKNMFLKQRFIFRLVFFLAADIIFISLSAFLAFFVRFEGIIPAKYDLNILGVIFLASLITIPIFYFSKLYHFTWLYVSTGELIALIRATSISFLILAASFLFLREHSIFTGFPRSTIFVTYFFIFIFTGGIRFAKRISVQLFSEGGKERTLIVGAGRAGEQMLRSMMSSINKVYRPVGFVDDDPTKKGILIHGYKVLGRIEDIPELVKKHKVEGLIIVLPSAGSETKKEAVEAGRKAGLQKIKIVPAIEDVISGKARVGVGMLQDLEMDKLLSREPAVLDKKMIERFIRNKKVMITGAAGSIGSELCRQIVKFKPSLLLVLDQDETGIFNISGELKEDFPDISTVPLIADVQDEIKISRIFSRYLPDIVFHAAAYKHVPLMEEYPEEAVKNNIFGTLNVVSKSLENKVEKLIFISTDKAVNP